MNTPDRSAPLTLTWDSFAVAFFRARSRARVTSEAAIHRQLPAESRDTCSADITDRDALAFCHITPEVKYVLQVLNACWETHYDVPEIWRLRWTLN